MFYWSSSDRIAEVYGIYNEQELISSIRLEAISNPEESENKLCVPFNPKLGDLPKKTEAKNNKSHRCNT